MSFAVRVLLWAYVGFGIPFLIVAPSIFMVQILMTTIGECSFTNTGFVGIVIMSVVVCFAWMLILDMRIRREDKNNIINNDEHKDERAIA